MSITHITYCCVAGCNNSSKRNGNTSFFLVPADDRRDEWLRLIGREDLSSEAKNRKVCDEHFSNDDFVLGKKLLNQSALPSRNLPSADDDDDDDDDVIEISYTSNDPLTSFESKMTQTEDEGVNTTASDEAFEGTSRNTFKELCNVFLTKELTTLMKANEGFEYKSVKTENKKYKKEETDDFSIFCFKLYLTSPQIYKFFQNLYGWASAELLLKKYIQKSEGNETLFDYFSTTFSTLKTRVDRMSTKEKICSVLIQTVTLKENLCYNVTEDKIYGFEEINGLQYPKPATTALVLMIRSMFTNWKQTVGYILLPINENASIVEDWIDSLLRSFFEIGLDVQTLVSSTKEDLINKIIDSKSVSIDTPYFFVDNKKIYILYDTIDLICSIRDDMLCHDFHFENKKAVFDDIIKFYEVDHNRDLPYARKLTEFHIKPENTQTQDVKYAVQLFSKTVAHGLWNYMQFGFVKNAEIGTVEFISNVNDLFDILNISTQNRDDNDRKRPFCEEGTHNKFLKDILVFFQSLKVIHKETGQNVTATTKFISGVLITVKAILLLYNELKSEGHALLLTRNLHREALDDFLKEVHSRVYMKPKKLTTLQFARSFRKVFISNLLQFTQAGSSKGVVSKFMPAIDKLEEENSLDGFPKDDLVLMNSRLRMQTIIQEKRTARRRTKSTDGNKKVDKEDYTKINTQEKHSLFFICGYLLMKVKQIHVCRIYKHYLYSNVYEPNLDTGKFQRYNRYKQMNGKTLLEVPCDNFVSFVELMDDTFVETLTNKHLGLRLAESMCKMLEKIEFSLPCPCFPKKYVIKLFIRIKIYYTIRVNNEEFKKKKRNLKDFHVIPKLHNDV